MACSGLLLIPSLSVSVALLSNLALEINRLADAGASSQALAKFAMHRGLIFCCLIVGVFVFFAAASVFLSLKLSNQVTGPVSRMENHMRKLLNKDYSSRTVLRKGDYLLPLAELMNSLSGRLAKESKD